MVDQKKMQEEEKQELSDEIINICNGNKGNIYCDKYELADMIKKLLNFMILNKQLTQQQNLDELMKQTLLNILSAKGINYTYYKNKKLTKGN